MERVVDFRNAVNSFTTRICSRGVKHKITAVNMHIESCRMLAWLGSSQRGGISWIHAESQYLGVSCCGDQSMISFLFIWPTLKVDISRVIQWGLPLTQLYRWEFEGIGITWRELTPPHVV